MEKENENGESAIILALRNRQFSFLEELMTLGIKWVFTMSTCPKLIQYLATKVRYDNVEFFRYVNFQSIHLQENFCTEASICQWSPWERASSQSITNLKY